MASPTLPWPFSPVHNRPTWVDKAIPLVLFAIALVPRLVSINRYVTPDELTWVYRSVEFREALLDGRWSDTLVAGHPGVTTTWLGASAISIQLATSPDTRQDYQWINRLAYLTPDNVAAFERLYTFLGTSRVLIALTTSMGIALIYWLVKTMWDPTVALMTALFLALDPFLAGLSGLLHVDALSATFAILCLLTFLIALTHSFHSKEIFSGGGWYAASGVFGALAALSKSPLLLLGPVVMMTMGMMLLVNNGISPGRRIVVAVIRGLIWGTAFMAVSLIALPALWSSPLAVMETLTSNANRHVGQALRPTFFLGQAIFDPGPLFYPAALLWRLGPAVVLAAIPAGALLLRLRPAGQQVFRKPKALMILLLVLWVVLFILMITPAAKKFDRYLLPVIPVLILLASWAWVGWWRNTRWPGRWFLPALVLVQSAYLLFFLGYPMSAYNPLVGGPWTAAHVLPVGWGEGISTAGRHLSAEELNPEDRAAMAGIAPSLVPFFTGQTLVDSYDSRATADYLIFTLNGRQIDPVGFEQKTAGLELVQAIRYGGLEQAWAFRQQPDHANASLGTSIAKQALFGGHVEIVQATARYEDDTLSLATVWQLKDLAELDPRYKLMIRLTDDSGVTWVLTERDLLGETYHYPADWPDGASGLVRHLVELPPAIPPDIYTVALALIDQHGRLLPVQNEDEVFSGVEYPVTRLDITPPAGPVDLSRVQIANRLDQRMVDGSLILVGGASLPESVATGDSLLIDLVWHADDPLPAGLDVQFYLGNDATVEKTLLAQVPLSRLDSGQWRAGETIQEKYLLSMPLNVDPGVANLYLEINDTTGTTSDNFNLGQTEVIDLDRSFQLPEDIATPVDVLFGDIISLQGYTLPDTVLPAGDAVGITLYWQAAQDVDDIYTVFLHLVGSDGSIVAQSDHWPGGLPTSLWVAGQVVGDEINLQLPVDVPVGDYRLIVGVYKMADGRRLTADDLATASSEDLPDDQFVLPNQLFIGKP